MDYAALNTAIAALSPQPVGYDAIAAALNAQTVRVPVPFVWKTAKLITQVSGSWSKIVLRARQSGGDAANLAAINAYEMSDDTLFHPTNPAAMGILVGGLAALQAAGDLTAADVTAIQALATPVAVPVWVPAVTPRDVWIARGQPE
jgi:hypothetical protein